jgi:GNAT superfamily N-acetyltransferase
VESHVRNIDRAVTDDEGVLLAAVANCAGAYETWVGRLGRRRQRWEDVTCVDLGLSVPLPVNGATVLREPDPGEVEGLLDRVAGFFAAGSGGPYEIWSVWPLPSLDRAGVPSEAVPCMVRDAGGTAPEAPGELEIAEAVDEVTVRQAEALIAEVFGAEDVPGSMLTLACLDERFRVWIGRVEGRPVTTAAAFIGDGFVGIYAVATTRDARGHGYGEAMTWAATLCRPELPATLQASPMGWPIYERIGYRTIAEFTVWELER